MEKHYSIDPGKGEKMDGCPYSTYEDGHDVRAFIIPPKGYIFTGFKFEPLTNNQIYDGKLIAQYEKSSFQEWLTSNLWKILIPVFIVAVIGIVVILAVSIFRNPKPSTPEPKQPETTIVATDTLTITDTEETTEEESTTPAIVPSEEKEADVINTVDIVPQQEEKQTITVENKATPAVADPNVQFKKEFWTLIHQRTIMMDPYHDLFVNYKDKASGEEYEYLRLVILKDYATFKEWYGKLHKVPISELERINTIVDLKKKLNDVD